MHPRDAARVFPEHLFARRIAVATCLLTATTVGGAVGVAVGAALCEPARAAAPAPSHDTVRAYNLRYAQWEIDQFVQVAFPRWAAFHVPGACPQNLIEVNAYQAFLHVVDPWGNPYHYVCTNGVFAMRAPGFDGQHGTADDLRSHAP